MQRRQIIIFLVTLTLTIGCTWLYQTVRDAYDSRDRTVCYAHLNQVGYCLHHYLDVFGQFPHDVVDESGRPLLSWRVSVLPSLGQKELFEEFRLDEPWDSKHNISLLPRMPPYFQCPASSPEQKTAFCTNYFYVEDKPVYAKERASELLLIECSHSDIPWTKPSDPAMTEQSFIVNSPGHSVSSNHDHGARVCRMDGSCRYVKTGKDARLIDP